MTYATPGDWQERTGLPVPTDPSELAELVDRLAQAEEKVLDLLVAATFSNVAGVPADPGVAAALTGAVLDQLAYSNATDPDGFGLGQEAITVGPISLGATPGSSGPGGGTSPRAVARLRRAGLLTTRVGY